MQTKVTHIALKVDDVEQASRFPPTAGTRAPKPMVSAAMDDHLIFAG